MGIVYFYAHSYCSYERGSNENNNRFIRRFIRKGTDIGKYSKACIKEIEKYINTYPRKQFGGKSADEVYKELFTWGGHLVLQFIVIKFYLNILTECIS